MKQILRRTIFTACGLLLIILLIAYLLLPSQPGSWKKIKLGLSSEEIYKIEPEFENRGMRELKGFDVMSVTRGKSSWQILIYYNNDVVTSIQKRFYHGGIGFCIYDRTTSSQ